MSNPNQQNPSPSSETYVHTETHQGHSGWFIAVAAGLVVTAAACGYLLVTVRQMNDQMAQMQTSTKSDITSLSQATRALLDERVQSLSQDIADVKGTADSTTTALKQSRAQAQKQSTELARKLEDEQKQMTDQLGQLKEAADNRIDAVSSDVSTVKTDVSGVRTDVNSVKTDVASAQAGVDKNGADLKRALGDMGVMSGLIATNAKDLAALRELGERNYLEFDLTRKEGQKKVGNITLAFKKSDPKSNRYTVDVLADDKRLEKRDRTINEPVQLYLSGSRQPYEIVVNQVKRDEIVGYIAAPKVMVARQ